MLKTGGPSAALNPAAVYNAAADAFDAEPLAFWARHGARSAARARLKNGDCVLDVGCGSGASALPAAEMVGRNGRVLGVDLAENLLALARAKAEAKSLKNVEFQCADMTDLNAPDAGFDVVVSVFSIFFVSNMERQVDRLWRKLRPGGRLVITVWGEGSFAPAAAIFSEEVRRVRPDIPHPKRPWERLTTPEGLVELFTDAGTRAPDIFPAPDFHPIDAPEDFWTIALGSGLRWEIEQLSLDERNEVKDRVVDRIARENIKQIDLSALIGVCEKPF
ncbi:MAG: class I SAM-dependent methyltransferase [Pseudomonadota bacterium]